MIMDIIMNRLNIDKYRNSKNPILRVYFKYLNNKLMNATKKIVEEYDICELLVEYITILDRLNNIGFISISDIKHINHTYKWYSLKFTEDNVYLIVEVSYPDKSVHIIRTEKDGEKTMTKYFGLNAYSGYNTEMDKIRKSTEEIIRKHIDNNLAVILKELKV